MPIDKCHVCGWEGFDDDLIISEDILGRPESICPQCGSSYVEPINHNLYDDEEDEEEDGNLI